MALNGEFIRISEEISAAIDIFSSFGLKVNKAKSDAILFRASSRKFDLPRIRLGDIYVVPSKSVKCLGVILHERLSWKDHVLSLKPKCYAVVAMLRRLRVVGVPLEGLFMVYKTLLVPVLSYCISLWGSGYDTAVHSARIMQNDAVRAIPNVKRIESVRPHFESFDLLMVDQLKDIAVALLAFKSDRFILPEGVVPPLRAKEARSNRRPTAFEVPMARKTYLRQSLTYLLPKAWGSIPKRIRSLRSRKSFVREVKKLLKIRSCASCDEIL